MRHLRACIVAAGVRRGFVNHVLCLLGKNIRYADWEMNLLLERRRD